MCLAVCLSAFPPHCRKELDPNYVPTNEPPSVLGNAACWSLHMGLSSNLRYQLLGGADTVSTAPHCSEKGIGRCSDQVSFSSCVVCCPVQWK